MSAIVEILIFLDYLSAVPDVCFNDTEIFFWIRLDNFSAVPDVSAEGYDVLIGQYRAFISIYTS